MAGGSGVHYRVAGLASQKLAAQSFADPSQHANQGFLIENRRTSAEQREYASQYSTTQDGRTGTRAKGIVLG